VVQDIEDLIERDVALQSRGALVTLPHPKLGPFDHVRTPVSFSGEKIEPFRAPGMGEHSLEVAAAFAGLDAARIAALEAGGVFK
jgi:crotonobetainyl-CoA:carnitine CoA-transferase CaiB-like acyl-CoA transferase